MSREETDKIVNGAPISLVSSTEPAALRQRQVSQEPTLRIVRASGWRFSPNLSSSRRVVISGSLAQLSPRHDQHAWLPIRSGAQAGAPVGTFAGQVPAPSPVGRDWTACFFIPLSRRFSTRCGTAIRSTVATFEP